MSLKKWFKEDWVDISRKKKSGGFEKCLPAAKAAGLTEKQRKSAVRRKRAAGNPGGKPTNVRTFVKRKKRGSKKKK